MAWRERGRLVVASCVTLALLGVGTSSARAGAAGSADLSVTETGTPGILPGGADVTYGMTVTNNGPDEATGVILVDSIPSGLTLVSATASQGTCVMSTPATCDLSTLQVGASATASFLVDTPCLAASITDSAIVLGDQLDPDPANNASEVDTTLETPCLGVDQEVEDGGFVTTDPEGQGPRPDLGVFDTSSITVPAGVSGDVSIGLTTTNPPPPSGACPLFRRLIIGTMQPAASQGNWLTLVFTYDVCSIPPGTKIQKTTIRESSDGITYTPLPNCRGNRDDPDPCVHRKLVLPDGSFQYTIYWSGEGDPSWRPG